MLTTGGQPHCNYAPGADVRGNDPGYAAAASGISGMFVDPPDHAVYEDLVQRASDVGGAEPAVEAATLAARANDIDPEAPGAGQLQSAAVTKAANPNPRSNNPPNHQ